MPVTDKTLAVSKAFDLEFGYDFNEVQPAFSIWESQLKAQWDTVIQDYAAENNVDPSEIEMPEAELDHDGVLYVKTMSVDAKHDVSFWNYLTEALNKSDTFTCNSTRERGGLVKKVQ